ncbi:1-phosphofructokinase family hexose kinase [Microbacterium sp. 179-I 3D3 NHS]|uniref:1-phosphofructokinase family hexose kinase n=1 Tax=Microbacterium sp. 179-I 3D3 NHS TaxID=3142382 RepID=UPI0039A13FFE
MIAILALSPALDVTYDLDALRHGEINRPLATTAVAGGKALNAARAARALGADVHVTVALGGENGERVGRRLRADGVAMTEVALAAETRTCLALVEAGGGASSTDVYEPAAPLAELEWARFAAAVRSAPAAAWLGLSGSIPGGVPLEGLRALLAEARSRGSRVALDTSGAALGRLAGESDLLKVNRAEAADLLGRDLSDAAAACAALHDRFGVDAVVTDGVRGGAALHDGEPHRLPAPQSVGRYPAGSGDSFFGGLLHALDRGFPFATALDLARDAAERNARVPGQGVLAPV